MKCSRPIVQNANRSYEWILFVPNTMKLYYPLLQKDNLYRCNSYEIEIF